MTLARTTARGALLTLLRAPAHRRGGGRVRLGKGAARSSSPCSARRRYIDDFGDPRGQGGHEGNDIMAPRRALALAAEAGTVKFCITSSRAGCMLYLEGESGTEYLYIHLNNDLDVENDNQGQCVPGVAFTQGAEERSEGAGRRADRLRRRLGRRGRDPPAPPLRGAPERRRRGQPVPVPAQGEAAALRGPARDDLHARAHRHGGDARPARTSRSASTRCARGRAGAGSSRPARRSRSPFPRRRRSRGSTGAPAGLAFSALELLTKGLPVTIWTAPAKVTLAAQSGAKGALAASRVVVKPVGESLAAIARPLGPRRCQRPRPRHTVSETTIDTGCVR